MKPIPQSATHYLDSMVLRYGLMYSQACWIIEDFFRKRERDANRWKSIKQDPERHAARLRQGERARQKRKLREVPLD